MLYGEVMVSFVCVCVCLCENPPENQCVSLHVQVSLAGQEVESEEAVVTPAFTDLKVRRKLTNDVFCWVTGRLMDHLYTVLISTRRKRTNRLRQHRI